jgi:type IV pilus assembly protein PilE
VIEFNLRHMKRSGFSLIELMFVVAIAGVIAMVAIPAYNKQIQKNARAVAKARLAQAAQLLERFYSDNSSYFVIKNTGSCAVATGTTAASGDGFMKLMNAGWNCSGSNTVYSGSNNESTSVYTITLTSDNTTGPNAFTLTAAPVAGSSQASDTKCMNLTLTNAGVKGISGSGTLTDCW